jgi:DNA ligase D-like protein (predicted ligase)
MMMRPAFKSQPPAARGKGRSLSTFACPEAKPMLATLIDPLKFAGRPDEWVFERKLDGIRAVAIRRNHTVRLISRNDLDLGHKYPEVAEVLSQQPLSDFIIDGEIVAFAGRHVSFQQLQQRLKAIDLAGARRGAVKIAYYVFDVQRAAGHDTRSLPLLERKKLLKRAIVFDDVVRFTPHKSGDHSRFLADACRRGWEGLIAKKVASAYVGRRSTDWIKLKCQQRQEFVIGGYTDPAGSRIVLGALLVGYYEDRQLRYAGKVGTGYSLQTLRSLGRELSALKIAQCPFAPDPALPRKAVHWLKPKLVAEVEFSEWTRDGKLRHPQFLGLRTDKSVRQIVRESPRNV